MTESGEVMKIAALGVGSERWSFVSNPSILFDQRKVVH